jgi:hypothetical protein
LYNRFEEGCRPIIDMLKPSICRTVAGKAPAYADTESQEHRPG